VKIRNYLSILLFAISIIPVIFIMLFSVVCFGKSVWQDMQESVEDNARLTADTINQFFTHNRAALSSVAEMPAVQTFLAQNIHAVNTKEQTKSSREVNELLALVTTKRPQQGDGTCDTYVRNTSLVNAQGSIIASDDTELVGTRSSLAGNESRIEKNGFSVSNTLRTPGFLDGIKYFIIAVPIYKDGVFVGYIQSAVDMVYFDLSSHRTFMKTGWTMVVDGSGMIAGEKALDDRGLALTSLKDPAFESGFYQDVWQRIDLVHKPNGFLNFQENGGEKLGYYTAVPGTDWVIFSVVPDWELKQPIYQVMFFFFTVLLLVLIVLMVVIRRSAKRFLNPLHDMSEAFLRLMQRDYTVRLSTNYKGEFADISASFNKLAEKIRADTEELKVNEARYALIMEETNQVIFEWDMQENQIFHTVHWTNKFGFNQMVRNPGSELPDFSIVHPDDRKIIKQFFWEAREGRPPKPVDVRMKTIDSKYIWCTISIKVIFDENKRPFRAIGLITDTDHQKKIIQTLESKSRMDLLTQTYNKVTAEKMIEDFLSTAPPEENHGFIIIDIDNFKGINDTLGHIYGDSVLKQISARLKDLFRATDIVGRAGGDEFIILVKNLRDEQVLKNKLSEICNIFRSVSTGENEQYRVSASVGAAVFPNDGTTFAELYQHADSALYRAKRMGKDGFSLYCEGQLKSSSEIGT